MWFYTKNGEQQGPVEQAVISEMLQKGELSGETMVWKEGMAQWVALSQVAEFQSEVTVASASSTGDSGSASEAASPAAMDAGNRVAQPQLVAPLPTNSFAVTSLVLGILSLLCTLLLTGIPAIIFGHLARKQFRTNPGKYSGQGMATAGLILGYIGSVIGLVVAIFYVVAIMAGIAEANAEGL